MIAELADDLIVIPTAPGVPDLVRADRCDACGSAQALYRVRLASGKLLDFCQHHYIKHDAALAAGGAIIAKVQPS